jgi:phosphoribosylanthranilate isomerase
MPLIIKLCGMNTPAAVEAALQSGADWLGFVFHPQSPRRVGIEEARTLSAPARGRARCVALVADAADAELGAITSGFAPDMWQFHGGERPERLRDIRAIYGLPILKAVGIAGPSDLDAARAYAGVADHLLLDAKAPAGASFPGGHGEAFDWRLLAALPPSLAFMLSGGLRIETVERAIRDVRGLGCAVEGVDVSSGIETRPGLKDPEKILAFVAAVRAASPKDPP